MYKEIIISVVVIVVIVVLNFFVGRAIDDRLNIVCNQLGEMRKEIENKNYTRANEISDDISNYWKDSDVFLSCYIEHDELEKVQTEFTSLKACLEIHEEDCLEYIDRMDFVIRHIEEKDDLVWENIL